MKISRWMIAPMMAACLSMSCSPTQVLGGVADQTTQRVSDRIAEEIVNSLLGDIGPRVIRAYTVGLMQVMFYQGGYHGTPFEYEPGQYTAWTSEDSPYGERFERAFLQRTDEGWEWWRVEIFGEDPETDDDMHLVLEALFEPVEDRRYIRELFVLYPDDVRPTEVEIKEEDAESWVLQAEEWSEEEITQTFVRNESVTVPAGTFQADLYAIEAPDDDDVLTEWWLAEGQVPGSVVKIRQTLEDQPDEPLQTIWLDAYGSDAVDSKLGAF